MHAIIVGDRMDTTYIQLLYKNKKGRSTHGSIQVHPAVLEDVEKDPAKQMIRLVDGRGINMKELLGDCRIPVDAITLAQLFWLCQNRDVVYMFISKDLEIIELGIRKKEDIYTR